MKEYHIPLNLQKTLTTASGREREVVVVVVVSFPWRGKFDAFFFFLKSSDSIPTPHIYIYQNVCLYRRHGSSFLKIIFAVKSFRM